MKQKQVKANPKNAKQAKVTKKQSPAKKVKELEPENDEEEETPQEEIVPVKKAVTKKKSVVPVQQPEEEEEDEAENDEEEHVEEEDDEEDEEQDDEQDEEQDDDNEEEEDDDGPTETGIDEEPTIPSKVKSGPIPDSIPITRVVHVNKLPKQCKKVDIVEVFAKYGPIEQIHIVTSPTSTVANVAFKTDKAATAALAANKTVKVKDSTIEVSMKKEKFDVKESRDRSVYVKYLKKGTTEEQIKEHFEGCGEIDRIKLIAKNSVTFAFVTFVDKEAVVNAKKLHNSVLNDTTIWVYKNTADSMVGQRDEKLTVILKNKQGLDKLEGSVIETIFAKCGEIENMDVLCKKNTLAFITFKTEEAVKKAFKLNGKTVQDVVLDIEHYDPEKKKTSIYVSNIHKDATEEDLQALFSKAGEIVKIVLKKGFAIIHFTDSDAYCKSFLLNEAFIRNQIIFVEPHSMRKQYIMKNRHSKPFKKNNKRSAGAHNGSSVFTPKKAKHN